MSRHLFITGASSGIGHSLAERMAKAGWRVTAIARRADKLDSLSAQYPSISACAADVTDASQIKNAVQKATATHGPVDLAILNAGIYIPASLENFSTDLFARHMQVNYMGVIHCLDCLIPAMLERGSGHLALMGSVAGYRGLPRSAAYGPTKAALQNLAESLYFDLHPRGIKLQIINPGFVETEATAVNDFVMPDLITSEAAAEHIEKGLNTDEFEISFPKSFVRKMKFMRLLPVMQYLKMTARLTGRT